MNTHPGNNHCPNCNAILSVDGCTFCGWKADPRIAELEDALRAALAELESLERDSPYDLSEIVEKLRRATRKT